MPARVAIVSTPRSGNMWLRRLLRDACGWTELSADTPAAVPWQHLPERVLLQLHWSPDDAFVELLERHGIAPVVLARHPLDVLVSILQFAQHEGRTARWLNGAGGNERALVGAGPSSAAFREYALSQRAGTLLDLTPSWWDAPVLGARVRYEDLVADPAAELARVLDALELEAARPVDEVVEASSADRLRAETGNGHVWNGRAGGWRSLVTAQLAEAVASIHPRPFDTLGYLPDADPELRAQEADERWRALHRRPEPRPRTDDPAGRVARHAAAGGAEVVDLLYDLILRRPVDEAGRARAAAGLATGTLSVASLVDELVNTPEARRVRALDDAVAFARWARAAGERPRGLHAPRGVDETPVALAWALARYRGEPDVLDVGTSFADPAYVAALVEAAGGGTVIAVDPAPCAVPGLQHVPADVRALPLQASSVDVAFCLAVLHHVGCDNRPFGLPFDDDPNGPLDALRELNRVVRPGGRVLVSVPTGVEQDLGLFVQVPPVRWLALFRDAGFFVFEHELYELGPDGWGAVPEVGPIAYGTRGPGASAVLCAELRPGRTRQAVRRRLAVARSRAR